MPKNSGRVQRWKFAQESELRHWLRKLLEQGLCGPEVASLRQRAANIEEALTKYINLENVTALHIGPAVVGEIHFLPCARRYALDPLGHYYRSQFPEFFRDIAYIVGLGEAVPVTNGVFDIVIATNLLDHVIDPAGVVREMARVVKPEGYVYLGNDLYSVFAAGLRSAFDRAWQVTKIARIPLADAKHPHSVTEQKLREWVTAAGFKILWETCTTWKESRAMFRESPSIKVKLLRGYGPFPVQKYEAVLQLRN